MDGKNAWWRRGVGTLCLACIVATNACSAGGSDLLTSTPAYKATRAEIGIVPIAQQTQQWCWAASAEMILLYYQEPDLNPAGDYQCGVVGGYYYLAFGPTHPCVYNCYLCPQGASSTAEIQRILDGYGLLAQTAGLRARVLQSQSKFGPLTLTELAQELDARRPVLAGVSFPGQPTLPGISGHAVVISGYDATGPVPTVTVRDPYPYERFLPANQNPYLVAGGVYAGPGTYRIALVELSSPIITWGNTIYHIQ